MKAVAAFVLGVLVALAGTVVASQVSSAVTISCNADGTMDVGFVKKP